MDWRSIKAIKTACTYLCVVMTLKYKCVNNCVAILNSFPILFKTNTYCLILIASVIDSNTYWQFSIVRCRRSFVCKDYSLNKKVLVFQHTFCVAERNAHFNIWVLQLNINNLMYMHVILLNFFIILISGYGITIRNNL